MNNYQRKIYNFFIGRNGVDDLYKFNLTLLIILFVINLFISNKVIDYMELILFIILFYRFLSKNISKRRKENNCYLRIKISINKKINVLKNRWKDRNTHIYKRCKNCKQICRLPLKKGKNKVKCPKCKSVFYVRCYRNEKVKTEIIKNKRRKK